MRPLIILRSLSGFNSIKVRLIQHPKDQGTQNHSFQFHKGSINTERSTGEQRPRASFNSIKVRLIRIKGDEEARSLLFQFHKGSINTIKANPVDKQPSVFQFHKGSINTNIKFGFICPIPVSIP